MAATRASSGGTAASSQFDNHADHIDAIEAAILSASGGSAGAVSIDANVGWQEKSATTSNDAANGTVTVTHGLGWTPSVVLTQMRGNPNSSGPYATYVSTVTSSSFIVFFRKLTDGTAALSGQAVVFDWIAFK